MQLKSSFSGYPFPTDLTKEVILFRRKFAETEIILKPLHLSRDIKTIHKWVNMPYAKEFWQMAGSIGELYTFYEKLMQSGKAYSLVAFLNNTPVAQIDYYDVPFDEVKNFYDYKENDHGIHLLMAPNKLPVKSLTPHVMITALAFLFSLGIPRIMGEPDAANEKANKLVQKVGFSFIGQIKMSYKVANLYQYTQEDFLRKHG